MPKQSYGMPTGGRRAAGMAATGGVAWPVACFPEHQQGAFVLGTRHSQEPHILRSASWTLFCGFSAGSRLPSGAVAQFRQADFVSQLVGVGWADILCARMGDVEEAGSQERDLSSTRFDDKNEGARPVSPHRDFPCSYFLLLHPECVTSTISQSKHL